MTRPVVEVWWAGVGLARDEFVADLDEVERGRLAAYVRDVDKARFLLGVTIVRRVLAARLSLPAAKVVLDRTCPVCGEPHGKVRVVIPGPSPLTPRPTAAPGTTEPHEAAEEKRRSAAPPGAVDPSGAVDPLGAEDPPGAVDPSRAVHPLGAVDPPGEVDPLGAVDPPGEVDPLGAVELSVTHSGEWVGVAVADLPVGIDVEWVDPELDVDGVARVALSADEARELSRSAGIAKVRAFTTYWTRKEAVVKATGEGLRGDLGAAVPDGVQVQDLEIGTDHRAALAVISAEPPVVQVHDATRLLT